MDSTSHEVQARSAELIFDALFRDHYSSMVRLATFLVDQQPVAEELVQDAFRRMWETFDSVEEHLPFLRRCVVNAAHGELRRRRVRRLHPDPLPQASIAEPDFLLDLLAALSLRKRTALVLRFYGGLSMQQIADAMDISTGTVKSTIHRGLSDLRKELS